VQALTDHPHRSSILHLLTEARDHPDTDIEEYAELLLNLFEPPTCSHDRLARLPNGYILCEDCGDPVAVWMVAP
jgi:hypothetical protein